MMFAITERLLLRPGWAEDAPALAAAIGDESIARHLARMPFPCGVDDAHRYLALPAGVLRPRFLMFLRDGGRLIGGIGLHGEQDAELAYWIVRDEWGRGFASEAGRAVVALADGSLRLPRLISSSAPDNPASGSVLAKLGFRAGGHGRLHGIGRDVGPGVRLLARDRPGTRIVEPLAA